MSAVSSKSASLRSSSLYFQRRVPRSRSNTDLPSPSLSSEDEITSSKKPIGETSQGIVKDKLFNKNLPTTK
ncbi:unnamed protein product, partial [Rotaria sp. Silwood2]